MKIEFQPLFTKQRELDEEIQRRHNVTYEETLERRFLSLYVEIGELANATRCFKYWSNKPSEPRDMVMDEYADGLHFLLSIGIALGIKTTSFNQKETTEDLSNLFIEMYHDIDLLHEKKNEDTYQKTFETFLLIASKLMMDKDDIYSSYLLKLGENYHRQETNY
ncbi:MAG: dUTP diphosphatase [Bacilli bacterium]|nr:dUTP diphosphatase [Bacilli bacterium]